MLVSERWSERDEEDHWHRYAKEICFDESCSVKIVFSLHLRKLSFVIID